MARRQGPAVGSAGENSGYSGLLLVPFLVVIALNSIGLLFPSVHTWGFNVWGAFSPAYFLSIVVLGILCSIPPVARGISNTLNFGVKWIAELSPLGRGVAVSAISAVVGALFILFRSNAPIFGDGYTAVSNSLSPTFALPGAFHETIKFVPVMLYRLGATLLTKQMHLDSTLAFGIVSSIGGVFGFWGLWRLARSAGAETGPSIALMSAGLAGGCTVLFFGHIELYTWGIAVLLWLLAAAIDFVNGRTSAWAVWIWLAIAAAMQALFLPTLLVIALILLLLRRGSPDVSPRLSFGLSMARISLAIVVCSIVAGLFFSIVSTGFSFVPVWAKPNNLYWVFSLAHIADLLNLVFLTAPLVLVTLVFVSFDLKGGGKEPLSLGEKLLGTCVLSLFLVTFWLDPGLGALRDWDLLSFFGFPACVFGGALLLKRFPGKTPQALVTALSLCTVLVVPLPHVAERTDGEKALLRLDPMVWEDAHYQPSYDSAHVALPWAALIQTFTKHSGLADKYLWRNLSVDPESDICWFNLGEIELRRGHLDSAVVALEKAYRITPGSDNYLALYAEALEEKGEHERLRPLLPQLATLQTENPKALGFAGRVLALEGRSSDALPILRKAYLQRPWEYVLCRNMGLIHYNLNQYDSAALYFQKALPMAPKTEQSIAFQSLVLAQIMQRKIYEARTTLDDFQSQFPSDTTIPVLRKSLDVAK